MLAGSSGTHIVCVCEYHENFKLLVSAAQLEEEFDEGNRVLTHQEVLAKVICEEPSNICYLGQCSDCPGSGPLKDTLEVNFNLYGVDHLKFKQWTKTDGSSMEDFHMSESEFIDKLLGQIPEILKHDYLAKQQAKFLRHLKENLEEGKCVVIGDFSESYSPVWQDAVQGVHWSDEQVTIHPFVVYYKKDGKLEHLNFAAISDTKDHKNETVYAFLRKLVEYLCEKIDNLKHIYYLSDGAASQYKNRKNVFNLRCHFEDFGVTAEWHFFATSHGKGPCDGVAGAMKRLARRESLQGKFITTPKQFYEWALNKFKDSIKIVYVSKEDIAAVVQSHKERFSDAPEVQGISEAHAVIPQTKEVILLKEYSFADVGCYIYFGPMDQVEFNNLFGYVLLHHGETWTVALVCETFVDSKDMEVLLFKKESSFVYSYSATEQNRVITNHENVIAIINVEVLSATSIKIKREHQRFAKKWISDR